MKDKVTVAPSEEAIANSGQVEQATLWAKRTAHELKAMGINVNFAPVVDVGFTRQRSYGKDPETVTKFARGAGQGYQQEGLLFTLKHFPGIGRAKVDLHKDPDVIDVDKQILEQEDLVPFRNLIKEEDNQAFFIMVSHLKYLALDPEYPASVSERIITKLLRQQLGFQGLIVTDDMEMGALTKLYSFEQMGYMAVKAGADQLLVCHDSKHQIAVYNGILAGVKDGKIDRRTLDNAVRRVIKVKLQHLQCQSVDPEGATNIVGK
jgi:beta-N-acetylhexosaminidase